MSPIQNTPCCRIIKEMEWNREELEMSEKSLQETGQDTVQKTEHDAGLGKGKAASAKAGGFFDMRSAGFFMGTVISLILLPRLMKAVWMAGQGKELSSGKLLFCTFFAYAAAAVCTFLAVQVQKQADSESESAGKQKPALAFMKKENLLRMVLTVTANGLWILDSFLAATLIGNRVMGFLPRFVLLILHGIVFGYLLYLFLLRAADQDGRSNLKSRLKGALVGWLQILVFAVCFLLVSAGYGVLLEKYIRGFGKSASVPAYLVKMFLLALLTFAAMYPSFWWMLKSARKRAENMASVSRNTEAVINAGGDAAGKNVGKKNTIGRLENILNPAAGLLCMVILILLNRASAIPRADYVIESVMKYVDWADARDDNDDYVGVLREVELYEAVTNAWVAYIDKENETLEELAKQYPEEETIQFLNFYELTKKKKNQETVKQIAMENLLAHPDMEIWYFLYLDYVSDEKTDSGKEFKKGLVETLIAADRYENNALKPYELTERDKKEIKKSFDEEKTELVLSAFPVAQMKYELLERGGDMKQALPVWFEFAEQYPEHYGVQKLVLDGIKTLYETYRWERNYGEQNKLKEKIPTYIKRVDERLDEETEKRTDLTDEERVNFLISEKYELAVLLNDCNMMEELQEYLEKSLKNLDSELLSDLLLSAAMYNEDYGTAIPLLEKNMEKYPEIALYPYTMAVACFRQGEIDKSLEYAVKFADLAILERQDPSVGAEMMALVDIYVLGDKALLGYQMNEGHSIYQHLTEEQKEIVQKSEVLSTLLNAENYYCRRLWGPTSSWSGLYDEEENHMVMEELLQKLTAYTENYPNLSAPCYMLGKMYGNYMVSNPVGVIYQKEFARIQDDEKALGYYRKCLAIDDNQPAVWYSLACYYDYLKEYDSAYACAENAVNLLIDSAYSQWQHGNNHGYGVLDHAIDLINALKTVMSR